MMFGKLGDKEYSLELNLKDKDGNVIGTKTIDFKHGGVQEYIQDVSAYAKTEQDYEDGYAGYFYMTIDRMIMTADADFIPDEYKSKEDK